MNTAAMYDDLNGMSKWTALKLAIASLLCGTFGLIVLGLRKVLDVCCVKTNNQTSSQQELILYSVQKTWEPENLLGIDFAYQSDDMQNIYQKQLSKSQRRILETSILGVFILFVMSCIFGLIAVCTSSAMWTWHKLQTNIVFMLLTCIIISICHILTGYPTNWGKENPSWIKLEQEDFKPPRESVGSNSYETVLKELR